MKRGAVIIFFLSVCSLAFAGPQDSVGTKVKNGKIFILHKVEKSQGLYAISRIYKVPLNEIIEQNPGSDELLTLDQILLIPTGKDAPFEEKVVKDYFSNETATKQTKQTPQTTTFAKYHKVLKGETLYSISVLYKTQVDVIKSLNNMSTNELQEGIEILVPFSDSEKRQSEGSVVAKGGVVQSKPTNTELAVGDRNLPRQVEPVEQTNQVSTNKIGIAAYERKVERIPEYGVEKVWEKGLAGIYASSNANNTKVCSHHEAEIGTTIMVVNPNNHKAIFVKVVENHALNPASGNNVIMLSPNAMDYIGLEDGKSVEISFAR